MLLRKEIILRTKPVKTVKIVTLGCSKNIVDSELLMSQLKRNNITLVPEESTQKSDTVIINTCGFIDDAKEESIDTILQFIRAKEEGMIRNVIVMGCLSERYRESLREQIPEIDNIFGVWEQKEIIETLRLDYTRGLVGERELLTPAHYAYLKISEGCDHKCSFCAIPLIKGKHISRPAEDILAEASMLVQKGVKELILIAQDLTYYGLDIYKKRKISELVTRISEINGIEWIRLHYLYPARFPVDLLDVIRENPKVCNYIDLPFQHINTSILKSMKRGITRTQTEALVKTIREKCPGAALRTSIIVGYPGETKHEFEELKEFIRKVKFERLGVFTYSHEEDTPAYKKDNDVSDAEKQARAAELMQIQEEISWYHNQKKKGEIVNVLLDRIEGEYYVGRTEYDSPDIDNEVLVEKRKDRQYTIGDFYKVKINWWENFDLFGEIIE